MAGIARRFDVVLDGSGYLVAGLPKKPEWDSHGEPSEMGEQTHGGDAAVRMESCHLGAGYGLTYVPGCYSYALNLDASQPGLITLGPLVTRLTFGGSASVSDFFEIGSVLYALAGRYCKKIDVTNDTIGTPDSGAAGIDFGASTVASKAIDFAGNIYVGFTSDTAIQKFTGSAWSNLDPDTGAATLARAKYWGKDYLDSQGWRLWAGYSTAYAKGCTSNPLQVANYHANPYTIGDTGQSITGMTGGDGLIWVAKADGLYLLDGTDRNNNVLGDAAKLIDASNGANLISAGGRLYYPHATGLLEYDRAAGSIESVQPFARTGNVSPIYGAITAQARLASWHYAAIYNGTDTYLLKGRYPSPGEGLPEGWIGPMIWHPIAKLTGVQVNAMWVSGLTTPPRLWFGYTVGSTYDVGYIRIPKNGNQLVEANLTFAASGSLYYSPITFGSAGTPDEMVALDIENEGFSASTYAAALVSFDGGAYAAFGSNATTAGRTRISLPAGTWRGYRTSVRQDLTNASSASTPKIRATAARAKNRPAQRNVYTTTLLCMDDMRLRDGSRETRTGAGLVTTLEALRDAGPKTLVHYWTGAATTKTVFVEQADAVVIAGRGDEPVQYGVKLVMTEAT